MSCFLALRVGQFRLTARWSREAATVRGIRNRQNRYCNQARTGSVTRETTPRAR